MDLLLDTNMLLVYLRNNAVTRAIEAEFQFFAPQNRLIISVVSVGEIKSIAKQRKWGAKKQKQLVELLEDLIIADINVEEVIERYAEIDAFSQGKLMGREIDFSARNMGKNDIWIAATASVLDISLVTTDNDFSHLDEEYLSLQNIDIKRYL